MAREAKGGDKAKVAEEGWLRELVAALGEGRPGPHGAGARRRAGRAAQPVRR